MIRRVLRIAYPVTAVAAALAAAEACSSTTNTLPAGNDAGDQDGTAPPPPATDSGPGVDSSPGTDSGTQDGGASGAVTVSIGASGATATVAIPGGATVGFKFPASAAGKTVTLTPGSAADIGWPASKFPVVIKMEPDGTTFADPVLIDTSNHDLLVFKFPTTSTQSAPTPLALDGTTGKLKLTGFSTLAVVSPDQSCLSTSGWTWAGPQSAARCADAGDASAYVTYGCKAYDLCYLISAGCCEAPVDGGGDAGAPAAACKTTDPNVTLIYYDSGTNGGQYPYCAADAGAGDAADGGG